MATNVKSSKILHPDLSFKIVGLCFDVHNELGRYAREKQYADLLEKRLKIEDLKYRRELRIGDSGNIVDFLIEDKVLLELKTVRLVGKAEYRQTQNYLQRLNIKLGLIVNFSDKFLRPRRILRTNTITYS